MRTRIALAALTVASIAGAANAETATATATTSDRQPVRLTDRLPAEYTERGNLGGKTGPLVPALYADAMADMDAGRLTVDGVIDLQRAALSAPLELGGSGMETFSSASADGSEYVSHCDTEGYVDVVTVHGGDLDGDARDDFLTLPICYADDGRTRALRVEARRGTDGARLWTHTGGDGFGVSFADLDGDGTVEVVESRIEPVLPYQRVITPRGAAWAFEMRQTITAHDGVDGATLWTHQSTGVLTQALVGVAVTAITDMLTTVRVEPDADGDGGADVLITAFNRGEPQLYSPDARIGSAGAVMRGTVLAGRTGALVGSMTAALSDTVVCDDARLCPGVRKLKTDVVPWLAVSDDISGDGLGDVIGTSFAFLASGDAVGRVHAWSGGGAALWATPAEPRAALPLSAQLDGLGAADVLLLRADLNTNGVDTISMYEGQRGRRQWSQPIADPQTGMFVAFAGDTDGDGSVDIALAGGQLLDHVTITILSGAWGIDVWTRTVALPESAPRGYIWLAAAADLNGDGALDFVVPSTVYEPHPEYFDYYVFREAHGVAVDGATGADLWSTGPLASFGDVPYPTYGDADGDGAPDVWTEGLADDGSYGITVRDGLTRGAHYSFPLPPVDAMFAWVSQVVAGRYVGDDTPEVLVSRTHLVTLRAFDEFHHAVAGADGLAWYA